MDEQPRRVLDFWEAFDSIEPIGEAWMQTARIGLQIAAGQGVERLNIESFLPPRYHKDVERAEDTDADVEAIVRQLNG